MIKTNKELSQAVSDIVNESGMKKTYIADKLGIKREVFARMLNKKQFSLDDANKVLNILGYETETRVIKKSHKCDKKC